MTERLPRPDGARFPPLSEGDVRVLPAGSRADAIPAAPVFNEPLAHPGLRPALEAYAAQLGLGLDV